MTDTPTTPSHEAAEPAEETTADTLGEAGKRALDREREAHKAAAKRAAAAEARLRDLEDAGKAEAQRQADELERAKAELAEAKALAIRLTLSAKTGIPAEILAGPGDDMEAWSTALLDWKAAGVKEAPAEPASQSVPAMGRQPERSGNVPIGAQIAAAEEAGRTGLATSLKAMMLGQMPAPN